MVTIHKITVNETQATYISSYGPKCYCGKDHWAVDAYGAYCTNCGRKREGRFYGYINSYGPKCGRCGKDHWFVGRDVWACSNCGNTIGPSA